MIVQGLIKPTIDVVIAAGQSPIRGVTQNQEVPAAPYIRPNEHAYIMGIEVEPNGSIDSEKTRPLVLDTSRDNNLGKGHSFELSLAYEHKKKFQIIKISRGSSSLKQHWVDDSFLRDKVKEYRTKAEELYAGYNVRFHWLWDQWQESCTNAGESASYQADYEWLFNDIWSGYTLHTNLIMQVNNSAGSQYYSMYTANCNTIISAKEANATNTGATLISSNSLPLWDDVHLSSSGNLQYGEMLNDLINWY